MTSLAPTLLEQLETPVESASDLIIAGAGSAGIAAALAAARQGIKTTLIDSAGFPGGTLVSGLPLLGGFDGKRQIVYGIFQELIDALRQRNGILGDPAQTTELHVDMEQLKVILLEKLTEVGVTLRLHTFLSRAIVSEGRIDAFLGETIQR